MPLIDGILGELEQEGATTRRVLERGQLSVCLRLLDVPPPSVYGPTADENPFV
jgi:hypothetical protein